VGLHALVTQLCAPVDGQRAEDFIMQERMEEKEAIMMDSKSQTMQNAT
jgi:hypothetical protein